MKFNFSTVVVLLFILWIKGPLFGQVNPISRGVGPPGSEVQQVEPEDSLYSLEQREVFTIKRYFKSLAGKDSMSIARMWAGSLILPGSAQIYNREYWKTAVVVGSIGGTALAGAQLNKRWKESGDAKYKTASTLLYSGAALLYWGSILEGVASYKYPEKVLPARASLYSAMLPGLGQIYNGDYWKLPIFYGGFIVTGYFISTNHSQYLRYKTRYYESADPASPNYNRFNPQTMKYYMDTYRRYRDYSVLSGLLVYALNVIDANVFAHFQDFDVSDEITASLAPTIIDFQNGFMAHNLKPTFGLRLSLSF